MYFVEEKLFTGNRCKLKVKKKPTSFAEKLLAYFKDPIFHTDHLWVGKRSLVAGISLHRISPHLFSKLWCRPYEAWKPQRREVGVRGQVDYMSPDAQILWEKQDLVAKVSFGIHWQRSPKQPLRSLPLYHWHISAFFILMPVVPSHLSSQARHWSSDLSEGKLQRAEPATGNLL